MAEVCRACKKYMNVGTFMLLYLSDNRDNCVFEFVINKTNSERLQSWLRSKYGNKSSVRLHKTPEEGEVNT